MNKLRIFQILLEADAGTGTQGAGATSTPEATPPVEATPPTPPEVTFTQAQVDALVAKKVSELENEKEKQKKMTKEQIEIEKRDKRIAELEYGQKIYDVTSKLTTNNIPTDALDFIIGFKEEVSIDDRIKKLQTILNNSNKTYANQVLGSSAPPPQASIDKNHNIITREQFLKMSYTERVNLYNTNKELYNQLSKI